MRKISVLFMTFLLAMSMAVTGVYAAGEVSVELNDGSYLLAPSVAVEADNFVILEKAYFTGEHLFEIIVFPSVYVNGTETAYTSYETPEYDNRVSALSSRNWAETSGVGTYDFSALPRNTSVQYSSFVVKDTDGNIVVKESWGSRDDYTAPDVIGTLAPGMDYGDLFPSVLSDDAPSDTWIIWRQSYSQGWRYWLTFFPADWSNVGIADFDNTATAYWQFDGSNFVNYGLYNDLAGSFFWTDDVLAGTSVEDKTWASAIVDTGRKLFPITHEYLSRSDSTYEYDVELRDSGDWYCASNFGAALSAGEYVIKADFRLVQWSDMNFDVAPCGYGDWSGTGDVSPEPEDVNWLQRIYNAIVSGFQSVLDAIGVGGSGSDNPGVAPSDPVIPDDPATEEDESQSILDVIGSLFDALFGGLLRGVLGVVGSLLDFVGSSISDFFDLFTGSDGFFEFFDTEPVRVAVTSFFDFIRALWTTLPSAIRGVISFSVGMFVFFGVLKVFIH